MNKNPKIINLALFFIFTILIFFLAGTARAGEIKIQCSALYIVIEKDENGKHTLSVTNDNDRDSARLNYRVYDKSISISENEIVWEHRLPSGIQTYTIDRVKGSMYSEWNGHIGKEFSCEAVDGPTKKKF
ncbi:hypothetical protein GJ698_22075 [Pseudoduganella sp. FT26W]|uniref:Uncharacterized protein n=1 Tax=Duganella aquatilis TaxID=2666082 RepID=A0A844DCK0_9BURK|nr:hypothetical protein [Duganella aquatilis]MRW86762.1 hypothetical protein [Duganella aquatilis]